MATRKVKQSQIVNRTGGVETDDGRTLYGFDAEVYLRMKAKEDPEFEKKIGIWIESVIDPEKLINNTDLWASLKDGLVLCQLMNKLKPGLIPKYSNKRGRNGQLHPLMERENITLYLEACWKAGLSSDCMFIVADLHGRRGMAAVLNNLYALSNISTMWDTPVKVEPVKAAATKSGTLVPTDLTQKKKPKWNVELGEVIYTGDAVEDEVEAMEDELLSLRQQLEESQRTVNRLEQSKRNLNEQLKQERRKLVESDKEIQFLRSRGTPGASGAVSHPFVEELKKSRDELQLAYNSLLEQTGPGASQKLESLRKELEETRGLKSTLTDKLSKLEASHQTEVEKLRARISELKSLLSSGSGGGDVSDFVERINLLEEEKEAVASTYERRILELTSTIGKLEDEQSHLRTKLEELEELKESETKESSERRVAAEEALRVAKQTASKDIAKLQSEIAELSLAKDLATKQLETAKANYDTQLEREQTKMKEKVGQLQEEVKKLKESKKSLVKEQEAKRESLKQELDQVKHNYEQQLQAYKKEISELQKDKASLAEKLFEETKKLQQELFAKGAAAKASKVEDSVDFAREKAYLEEQHKIELEKLAQEKVDAVDAIERQLLDERRRSEHLLNEVKRIETSLMAELKAEKERAEQELSDMLEAIEELEREKEAIATSATSTGDVEGKIAELQAQAQQDRLKLENKIRELEREKASVAEDRDVLKSQLESEILNLKARNLSDTQKYKSQVASLERAKKDLAESLRAAEDKSKLALGDTSSQHKRFLDEIAELRNSFNLAVAALAGDSKVTLASLSGDWKEKCLALETKEQGYLKEIERLTAELKELQEANVSIDAVMNEFKQKQERSDKIAAHQHKLIQQLEKQVKDLKEAAARAPATPAATTAATPSAPAATPAPAAAAQTKKQQKADRRKQRQTVRLYMEKGSVEMDIERLKLVVEKIMVGDPVTLDECLSFKNLFKIDNGRRVLCFLLKEYSELAAEGEPFLISFSSFEMLRELITLVLGYLNLSEGADFISGRLLLECSSLIARESKSGGEVEFIQTMIKPHRCWRNTYFWEEYFWTQVSPKFEEITLETTEQEHAFFSVEIVEFAKRMWGWGNLSPPSIVLFVETLAGKSDLTPAETNTIVRMVEDFCAQQLNPKKAAVAAPVAAKENNAKLFVNRRTVAFSAQQLQQGFAQMGADFETFSDGFKEANPASAAAVAGAVPGGPGWLKPGGQRGSSARIPKEGAAPSPRGPSSLTGSSGTPATPSAMPALPSGGGRGVSLTRPRQAAVAGGSRERINTPTAAPSATAAAGAKARATSMAPEPHQMSKRKMLARTINLNSSSNAFIGDLLRSQQFHEF